MFLAPFEAKSNQEADPIKNYSISGLRRHFFLLLPFNFFSDRVVSVLTVFDGKALRWKIKLKHASKKYVSCGSNGSGSIGFI